MRLIFAATSLIFLGCSAAETVPEATAFPRTDDASATKAAPPPAIEPRSLAQDVPDADERDPIGPQARAALARGAYLVWGRMLGARSDAVNDADRGPDGLVRDTPIATYAIAADGAVLAEVPAAVFTAPGHMYRWTVRRVELPRTACRERADGEEAWQAEKEELARHPARTVDRAELVELGSGARRVVSQLRLDQAGDGDIIAGANDFSFDVALSGSVGTMLFVRERTWVDSCGAHGNAVSAAGVLDLANDAKVTDVGAIAPRALRKAQARAEKRFDLLRKEWNLGAEDEAALVELLPQYDARGSLSFLGRFATFVPYAFSSGDWASYAMATTTPLRAMPERLVRPEAAPPGVRALLAARPGFVMGGYGAVTPIAPR